MITLLLSLWVVVVGEIDFVYKGKGTIFTWPEHNFSMKLEADRSLRVVVVGEIDFVYKGKGTIFTWPEHNFSMKLEADSFPKTLDNITIKVLAFFGDTYKLPANVKPVSAFFEVQCKHESIKNISMTIEHYSANLSALKFIISPSKSPPYIFHTLNDGEFHKKHGILKRSQFSIFGIGFSELELWPCKYYYFAMYYSPPENLIWTIDTYVTKDSGTHRTQLENIAKNNNKKLNTHTSTTVNHTLDTFKIDISLSIEEKQSGWEMLSRSPIIISRGRIDYEQGISAPASFKIRLDKRKYSSDLIHNYFIENVHQENSLTLTLQIPAKTGMTL